MQRTQGPASQRGPMGRRIAGGYTSRRGNAGSRSGRRELRLAPRIAANGSLPIATNASIDFCIFPRDSLRNPFQQVVENQNESKLAPWCLSRPASNETCVFGAMEGLHAKVLVLCLPAWVHRSRRSVFRARSGLSRGPLYSKPSRPRRKIILNFTHTKQQGLLEIGPRDVRAKRGASRSSRRFHWARHGVVRAADARRN